MPSLLLAPSAQEASKTPAVTDFAPSAGDDFLTLLENIRNGRAPSMSAERRALAESAVLANEARKGEDVDAWSQKLASMVAGAND